MGAEKVIGESVSESVGGINLVSLDPALTLNLMNSRSADWANGVGLDTCVKLQNIQYVLYAVITAVLHRDPCNQTPKFVLCYLLFWGLR